jgi:hypothetical protein
MRKLILGALLLFSTAASAATDGSNRSMPLAPGKPAGVHKAQTEDLNPLIYFGAVGVGIGIALAVAGDNNNGVATPPAPPTTTTSTGTTV